MLGVREQGDPASSVPGVPRVKGLDPGLDGDPISDCGVGTHNFWDTGTDF